MDAGTGITIEIEAQLPFDSSSLGLAAKYVPRYVGLSHDLDAMWFVRSLVWSGV